MKPIDWFSVVSRAAGLSPMETLGTSQQPPKATRVCMMCDRYCIEKECKVCGADTEKIQ